MEENETNEDQITWNAKDFVVVPLVVVGGIVAVGALAKLGWDLADEGKKAVIRRHNAKKNDK